MGVDRGQVGLRTHRLKPKTEETNRMSKTNLSELSIEELLAELERRKAVRQNDSESGLNTVSMEKAFKLAKEFEVDHQFSFKFGFPNVETNWIRWIEDNNLDMKPFTNWYDEDGHKVRRRPELDEIGYYPGWATIVLYWDGEVIQRTVCSDGGKLFDVLWKHCR